MNRDYAGRMREYKTLLRERDEFGQWDRWHDHLEELRAGERTPKPMPLPALVEVTKSDRRLTQQEHFAYWRERLTDQEIHEVGGAIDFLLREREAVA